MVRIKQINWKKMAVPRPVIMVVETNKFRGIEYQMDFESTGNGICWQIEYSIWEKVKDDCSVLNWKFEEILMLFAERAMESRVHYECG